MTKISFNLRADESTDLTSILRATAISPNWVVDGADLKARKTQSDPFDELFNFATHVKELGNNLFRAGRYEDAADAYNLCAGGITVSVDKREKCLRRRL